MRKTASMVQRLPITKARINLGQLARRVRVNKEYFILEKDGIPVIGIMDAEELEDYLALQDPKVQRIVEQSRREHRAGKSRPAEELLAEVKSEDKSARRTTRRRKA